MSKRGFRWLILVTVILAAVLVAGWAAAEVTGDISDSGVLTLSGTGGTADYASVNDLPWYNQLFRVNRVIIGEGVTYLGDHVLDGLGLFGLGPARVDFCQTEKPGLSGSAFGSSRVECRYYSTDNTWKGTDNAENWTYLPLEEPLETCYTHATCSGIDDTTQRGLWTVSSTGLDDIDNLTAKQALELTYNCPNIHLNVWPGEEEVLTIFISGSSLDFGNTLLTGPYTITIPDSGVRSISNHNPNLVLTINGYGHDDETGETKGYFSLTPCDGTITFIGYLNLLDLRNTSEGETSTVMVNGDVGTLFFNNAFSQYPFNGDVTVTGTVAKGSVLGRCSLSIPGFEYDLAFENALIGTLTDVTAENGLLIDDGELTISLTSPPLNADDYELEYRLIGKNQSGDYLWDLTAHPKNGGMGASAEDLVAKDPTFTVNSIYWSPTTTVTINVDTGEQPLVFNGRTDAERETAGEDYDLRNVFLYQGDVVFNCPVKSINIAAKQYGSIEPIALTINDEVNSLTYRLDDPDSEITLGTNGSVQSGTWNRPFGYDRHFGPVSGPETGTMTLYVDASLNVPSARSTQSLQASMPTETDLKGKISGLGQNDRVMMDVAQVSSVLDDEHGELSALNGEIRPDETVAAVFDVSINKYTIDASGVESKGADSEITELEYPVSLSVANPANGSARVIRLHEEEGKNGMQAEQVGESDSPMISFTSNLFSKYVILTQGQSQPLSESELENGDSEWTIYLGLQEGVSLTPEYTGARSEHGNIQLRILDSEWVGTQTADAPVWTITKTNSSGGPNYNFTYEVETWNGRRGIALIPDNFDIATATATGTNTYEIFCTYNGKTYTSTETVHFVKETSYPTGVNMTVAPFDWKTGTTGTAEPVTNGELTFVKGQDYVLTMTYADNAPYRPDVDVFLNWYEAYPAGNGMPSLYDAVSVPGREEEITKYVHNNQLIFRALETGTYQLGASLSLGMSNLKAEKKYTLCVEDSEIHLLSDYFGESISDTEIDFYYYIGLPLPSDKGVMNDADILKVFISNFETLQQKYEGSPSFTVTAEPANTDLDLTWTTDDCGGTNNRVIGYLNTAPTTPSETILTVRCEWGQETAERRIKVHAVQPDFTLPTGLDSGSLPDTINAEVGDTITIAPQILPSGWNLNGNTGKLMIGNGLTEFAIEKTWDKASNTATFIAKEEGQYTDTVFLRYGSILVGKTVTFNITNPNNVTLPEPSLSGRGTLNYYIGEYSEPGDEGVGYFNDTTLCYIDNLDTLKATYGNHKPFWQVEDKGNSGLLYMYDSYNENSLNIRVDQLPTTPMQTTLQVSCTYGAFTSTEDITVNVVTPANGLPAGFREGSVAREITVDLNGTFTVAPQIAPEGWTLPGYSPMLEFNTGEIEEFGEIVTAVSTDTSKTVKAMKSGRYTITAGMIIDSISVYQRIKVIVKNKDGTLPADPLMLNAAGNIDFYFTEGIELSKMNTDGSAYAMNDATYVSIDGDTSSLEGSPKWTLTPGSQTTAEARFEDNGPGSDSGNIIIESLPSSAGTETWTIECDWDGRHGEKQININFTEAQTLPTGIVQDLKGNNRWSVMPNQHFRMVDYFDFKDDWNIDGAYTDVNFSMGDGWEYLEWNDDGSISFNEPGIYEMTIEVYSRNIAMAGEYTLYVLNEDGSYPTPRPTKLNDMYDTYTWYLDLPEEGKGSVYSTGFIGCFSVPDEYWDDTAEEPVWSIKNNSGPDCFKLDNHPWWIDDNSSRYVRCLKPKGALSAGTTKYTISCTFNGKDFYRDVTVEIGRLSSLPSITLEIATYDPDTKALGASTAVDGGNLEIESQKWYCLTASANTPVSNNYNVQGISIKGNNGWVDKEIWEHFSHFNRNMMLIQGNMPGTYESDVYLTIDDSNLELSMEISMTVTDGTIVLPQEPTTLFLPEALTTIGSEAFAQTDAQRIIIPDGCTTIGSKAFANCLKLLMVEIPRSVTQINDDMFDGCTNSVIILTPEGSAAWQWAEENGYRHYVGAGE